MTETELLDALIGKRGLAPLLGWRTLHIRPAMVLKGGEVTYRTAVQGDGAGFPDLLMVRPPRLVIAELKGEKGRLTLEQECWLDAFRGVTQSPETHIWKPGDIDAIAEVLR